jgi:uncharacterized membrane protein YebE (DUF533 family)
MDASSLLNQLLQSGRELAAKGQDLAQTKLNLPAPGPERDALMQKMGKGATVAGVLALLLGTRPGRRVTGAALKLGSLAALGGLAYQAYQNWQGARSATPAALGAPVDQLTGPAAEQRSRSLIKAMLAAAKADGEIDPSEQGKIDAYLKGLELSPELRQFLQEETTKPLSVQEIAAGADSPAAAAEIYLTSRIVIDVANERERAYLDQLAGALRLPPEVVAELERQAEAKPA